MYLSLSYLIYHSISPFLLASQLVTHIFLHLTAFLSEVKLLTNRQQHKSIIHVYHFSIVLCLTMIKCNTENESSSLVIDSTFYLVHILECSSSQFLEFPYARIILFQMVGCNYSLAKLPINFSFQIYFTSK